MKIQRPTFNFQRPTPNRVGRGDDLDVRRSRLNGECSRNGSVLIIVLWIAFGLVSIALYFAHSMLFELRASDNRASGLVTDQAIEGAARYVSYVLATYATNGAMPQNIQGRIEYACADVPIGNAHFWIIGRDPSGTQSSEPYFGLIDEGSKLNLNTAGTNMLWYLPNMTLDFANAIVDWRSTNGSGMYGLNYGQLGYEDKNAPFETVEELRLVYGATMDLLAGDDINRNGVLDANEKSLAGNGLVNPGLFNYVTIYTREPNFHSDGTVLTNVNTASPTDLQTLFQDDGVNGSLAQAIIQRRPPGRGYAGMLDFCLGCRTAGMSTSDFAKIYSDVTTSSATYIRGRVNVNTASAPVLEALLMGLDLDQQTALSAAQSLISYRQQNPDNLTSVAWVIDALGESNPAVQALARGDYITTRSFQFTADIAAVGPFGRGYRRVKFIFDTSDGIPKIIYRQDLTRLGWALGDKVRQTLLADNTTQQNF